MLNYLDYKPFIFITYTNKKSTQRSNSGITPQTLTHTRHSIHRISKAHKDGASLSTIALDTITNRA